VLTRVVEAQVDNLPMTGVPADSAEAWRELADEFGPTFFNDAGCELHCRRG